MTTTVHKNLTGSDLHEPKGADTALANQVYVSDGAGSGVWVSASSIITNTAFTTGDLKPTHKVAADTSWILWSDGTIGDSSSSATVRANADVSALFALYWNNYSNTLCPVSSGRGLSAAADFAAHKTLALPLGAGRALGLAGNGSTLTSRTVGVSVGAETSTLITANLPPYTPSGTIAISGGVSGVNAGAGAIAVQTSGATQVYNTAEHAPIAAAFSGTAQGGTSTPVSIMQPTSFVNIMIKL